MTTNAVNSAVFAFPVNITLETIEPFFREIFQKVEEKNLKEVIINFNDFISSNGRVEPIATLRTANNIEAFKRFYGDRVTLKRYYSEATLLSNTYARTMRVFSLFNIPFGDSYKDDFNPNFFGKRTYIPLILKNLQENVSESLFIEDDIDKISKYMANILTMSSGNENVKNYFSYSLNELIRNIIEHSDSRSLMCMAQEWAGQGGRCIEVGIMDLGQGIHKSLEEKMNLIDDKSISPLQLALLPGASSKVTTYVKDDADNSGFGLYMISEIVRKNGEFFVFSGNQGYTVFNDNDEFLECHTLGTLIGIKLYIDNLSDYELELEALRKQGLTRRILTEQFFQRARFSPGIPIDWSQLFQKEFSDV